MENLDSEKANGDNKISRGMLKRYGSSICGPLEQTLKSCLERGIFPLEWKKANFVPVHKNDK